VFGLGPLQLPDLNGLDAIEAIRSEFPDARIVVLTTFASGEQLIRATTAGTFAYLSKGIVQKELRDAIRSAYVGRRFLLEPAAFLWHDGDEVTQREVEILEQVSAGHRNEEIAARLGVSDETVKADMHNIMVKLGAHDRTSPISVAVRRGILKL
jgi:DNA-binding NarL/FixJ family response regulator